ncbi:hydroxyacylglutathione hydrolase [Robbsia sp. Bb-Pol-6]|uniref:Hydroxyacylglutathione hydrolase n=1 Tax=Robbsia betulipollinis TaxID=2981849 RepID=A0ABT3ZPQ2_9BURK|nr:hydroxyacylglutathione hydrolase [Robbsia betulipollinis]MCY0388510.1 hydroxyacylglutathione hydrolase [Robbsia betulipollinis]
MLSVSTALRDTAPLQVLPVAALADNYIWLIGAGREVIVVDPGDARPVVAALAARGWTLSAILLTHHHADHVGGVAGLLAHHAAAHGAHATVPVYGPAGEDIAHVTHRLRDGDTVEIAQPAARFTVIDVPGHTRGHIAFHQAAAEGAPPRVFCGDTLFATGCGRLFEGTPAQMQASLDRLAALDDATRVHCAHEYTLSNIRFALACDADNADLHAWHARAQALREQDAPTLPTTLGDERRVNPFLRTDAPAIRAALHAHLGRAVRDRLDAFTELRAWKDRF